jgi:hypothetical protein
MANGWIEVDKKNPDGPKVIKKVEVSIKILENAARLDII